MPLNTPALKTSLATAFNTAKANTTDPVAAINTLCDDIGNAFETWLLDLEILYTTGMADASGPVTGAFGYTLG